MAEEQLFYRFRTLKHIFEYKELENQEIYFASPEELNDPMEGFKNIIFQGDNILWHNLIRHYLACLTHMYFKYNIIHRLDFDKYNFSDEDIYIDPLNTPNKTFKKIFNDLYCEFRKYFTKLIDSFFLENEKFLFIEFKFYLLQLNVLIYAFVHNYLSNGEVKDNTINIINDEQNRLNIYKNNIKNKNYNEKYNILTQEYNKLYYQLQHKFISKGEHYNLFIYTSFIEQYCHKLIYFAFPQEYVACFNKNFNNTIMWSHYAENHSGVCLIYTCNDDNTFTINYNQEYSNKVAQYNSNKELNNNITTYVNTYLTGIQKLKFYEIKYSHKIKEENFFLNLFVDSKQFDKMWYFDEITNRESFFYKKELEYKRNTKYNDYERHNLIKTTEWEYEQEYRLILDIIFPFKKAQITQYDFNNLYGIIFGIRTPLKERMKIINIVKDKCKKENRTNFNFYQAYYNTSKQCVDKYRLDYLDKILFDTPPTEQNNE